MEVSKELLEKEYYENNLTVKQISEKLSYDLSTLYKLFKKFEIKLHPYLNILNQRFERLLVESVEKKKHNRNYWNCKCDCGNFIICSTDTLISGKTKSCGCFHKEKISKIFYKGGNYITGSEYSQIKNQANRRKIAFAISIEDIENIYEKQDKKCSLTGIPIEFNTLKINGKIVRGEASIDRIDSSKGYVKDNIQIVHRDINIAKHIKSNKDFIKMCRTVTKYNEKNNI